MLRPLVVALVLLASPAVAAPAIPDTPAGHAMADFLVAFNAGDRASLEAFNAKYHRDQPVDGLLSFREYTGGIGLLKIESPHPGQIRVFAPAKESEIVLRYAAKSDPADATKPYDGYMEGGVPSPPELAPLRLSEADALAALSARAAALTARDRFAG